MRKLCSASLKVGALMVLMSVFSDGAPTSSAQASEADALFNLFGTVIQQGVRAEQLRQAEEQRRAEVVQQIKEIQTSLATLGFYAKAIDGDFGPGTQKALADFRRAFNLPTRPLSAREIQYLHERAQLGYRSLAEEQDARSNGFMSVEEYRAAKKGGFPTAREYHAALQAGLNSRDEYRAFQDARSNGFMSVEEYRAAKKGGFPTADEYRVALRAGFDSREEYRDFQRSGQPNRGSYLAAKEEQRALAAKAADCQRDVANEAWYEAIRSCNAAIVGNARSQEVLAAHSLATRQLELELQRQQAALEEAEQQVQDAKAAGDKNLNRLLAKAASIEALVAKARASLAAGVCLRSAAKDEWGSALSACREALVTFPKDADLDAALKIAEQREKERQEAAERERKRLALQDVRTRASTTIETLEAFSKSGQTFANGLAIARAKVALEVALKADNADIIEEKFEALQKLLDAEAPYVAFAQQRIDAARATKAIAEAAARSDAEKAHAFIADYLSRNIASPHASDLLAVDDALNAALSTGTNDAIVTAQQRAFDLFRKIGIADEAQAYEPDAAKSAERQRDIAANAQNANVRADLAISLIRDYTTSGAKLVDGLAVGRLVATLNRAETLETKVAALDALEKKLAEDAAFTAFRNQRQAAQAASLNDTLAIARQRLTAVTDFVAQFGAANPLAPELAELLDLSDRIETALASNNNAAIKSLSAESEALLRRFNQWESVQSILDSQKLATVDVAQSGIAVTLANKALLASDPRDIVVLRNASNDAPSIRINLAGNVTYRDGLANYCWFGNESSTLTVERAFLNWLRTQAVTGRRRAAGCDASQVDLVVFERRALLEAKPVQARALLDRYESAGLRLLETITWTEISPMVSADEERARQIAGDLSAGRLDGVGLLVTDASELVYCLVDGDHATAATRLLHPDFASGSYFLNEDATFSLHDAETAFSALKAGDCGGVVADAAPLKVIAEALKREGVNFSYAPFWASPSELDKAQSAIDAEAATLAQQRMQADQARQSAEQLASELAVRDERSRRDAEERLQKANNSVARAALNDLEALVAAASERLDNSVFAELAQWAHNKKAASWTLEVARSEVADYGIGSWKDRQLEAIIGEVHFNTANATLGERDSECWLLAILIDREFEKFRDPLEVPCNGSGAELSHWRVGHAFESKWRTQISNQ